MILYKSANEDEQWHTAGNKKFIYYIQTMKISQHHFETIDWGVIDKVKHAGEKGFALRQTIMMDNNN